MAKDSYWFRHDSTAGRDRAKVKMELTKHNAVYKDGLDLREVESKNFE